MGLLDTPDLLRSFFLADAAVRRDGVPYLVRNANARCPCSKYHQAEVGE